MYINIIMALFFRQNRLMFHPCIIRSFDFYGGPLVHNTTTLKKQVYFFFKLYYNKLYVLITWWNCQTFP